MYIENQIVNAIALLLHEKTMQDYAIKEKKSKYNNISITT